MTACSGKKDETDKPDTSQNTETQIPDATEKEEEKIVEETPEMKKEIDNFWNNIKPENPDTIKKGEIIEGENEKTYIREGNFDDIEGNYITSINNNNEITMSYFEVLISDKGSYFENDKEVLSDNTGLEEVQDTIRKYFNDFLSNHPNYIVGGITYVNSEDGEYREFKFDKFNIDDIIKKVVEPDYRKRWNDTLIHFVPTNGGNPILFSIQTSDWYTIRLIIS